MRLSEFLLFKSVFLEYDDHIFRAFSGKAGKRVANAVRDAWEDGVGEHQSDIKFEHHIFSMFEGDYKVYTYADEK